MGLLVVDEEQRFGVRHKERIKQMRKNVDVVTLTATPIPRTLHMSLVGLRDISIIQTPPKDRLAIQTVVAPFSDQIVRAALQQEIGRGGQIYFIHNRIETIWRIAAHLQELVPGIRIGVGHGQMSGKELEGVMLKFMHHEYDMLVSTTIVENGLDIPLANTIIVNEADHYGLAELYQLRGRVGRSNRRAYAYLLVPEDKELSDVARKRLAALKEFSELGSGFKIAALDLELRGAGNLLGSEQHGHIAAVGFETYCRMLEDAVRELRGEEGRARGAHQLAAAGGHSHSAGLHRRRGAAAAGLQAGCRDPRSRRPPADHGGVAGPLRAAAAAGDEPGRLRAAEIARRERCGWRPSSAAPSG